MCRHSSSLLNRSSRTLCALPLALIPASGWGQAAAPQELGAGLAQMLAGLVLVVGLIFASLWLLKRLAAPRGMGASVLRVVGGAAVGPRERVVVVEVGDTWLVVGVAPGHVSALHTLARQEPTPGVPATHAPKDFGTWLHRLGGKPDGKR
jgi:flagellar protein FliO/FliZ